MKASVLKAKGLVIQDLIAALERARPRASADEVENIDAVLDLAKSSDYRQLEHFRLLRKQKQVKRPAKKDRPPPDDAIVKRILQRAIELAEASGLRIVPRGGLFQVFRGQVKIGQHHSVTALRRAIPRYAGTWRPTPQTPACGTPS